MVADTEESEIELEEVLLLGGEVSVASSRAISA
jgi:hypothetical protein